MAPKEPLSFNWMISLAEIEYIEAGLKQGIRLDGRGCADFRPMELEVGIIAQANGSSRCHLGGTDVIVGVKVEVGAPDASLPDWGQLFCTVECSACASPEYEGRGGEQWSSELAGFLDRSLRPLPSESNNLQVEPRHHGIDLGQLKIITGKTCWNLYVDALVLNDDGNVLGALSLAALAALSDTKIPRVSILAGENGEEPEIELDDDPESSERLDLKYASAIVSVCQIGSALVVDLTAQEEECSRSTLHIAVNRQGMMCGMSKEGAFGIDPSSMIVAMEVASKIGGELTIGIANFQ